MGSVCLGCCFRIVRRGETRNKCISHVHDMKSTDHANQPALQYLPHTRRRRPRSFWAVGHAATPCETSVYRNWFPLPATDYVQPASTSTQTTVLQALLSPDLAERVMTIRCYGVCLDDGSFARALLRAFVFQVDGILVFRNSTELVQSGSQASLNMALRTNQKQIAKLVEREVHIK